LTRRQRVNTWANEEQGYTGTKSDIIDGKGGVPQMGSETKKKTATRLLVESVHREQGGMDDALLTK